MPYFSKVTLNPIPNWSGLQYGCAMDEPFSDKRRQLAGRTCPRSQNQDPTTVVAIHYRETVLNIGNVICGRAPVKVYPVTVDEK